MNLLAPPARVLVRAPSWLGDFVAAEPVVRALHARWLAAGCAERLSIAGPPALLALIDGQFDGLARLPVGRARAPDPRAWRGHDVALLLDGSLRSAWAAWRAGIPARAAWNSGGRAPLLTAGFTPAYERGAVPLALGVRGRWPRRLPRPFGAACVELAGLLGLEVRHRIPRLYPTRAGLAAAHARLRACGIDAARPYCLVNAGARTGSAKAADPAVLAASLRQSALPLVLVCGPAEEPHARAVRAQFGPLPPPLLDDPPPLLPELAGLIASCALFVTADSGPRHLAQALRRPTVVVCGPTDPRHTAEHAPDVRVVRTFTPCGPCHRETCPLSGDARHACMRGIDAAEVRRGLGELLAAGARG